MAFHWDDTLPQASWLNTSTPEVHWSNSLQRARLTPATGFLLGNNPATTLPVYLTPDQLRTHMHVMGSTGVGKSFFIEGLMKNLIVQGHGVCLLDPHGDLYDRLLDFCTYLHTERPELQLASRVIPFNLADTQHVIGFNPVARNARVMTYQVVALMEAIRKCWGQDDFAATPRLARWLYNTGYAVVDAGLTLYQARHMVNPISTDKRQAIISKIKDPDIRAEWEWVSRLKADKQEERLESSFNRIKDFVGHELIKLALGQYKQTLDVPAVLGGRKILLVNLAKQGTISEDNQHLLGTLIVNEILTAAFARPRGQRDPFFLFIDEFQHFVTKDMCEILDGGRKFGLHLILAHQHLNQTKLKDPEVYYSVLTNARLKVVFGGMADEDLDLLSKELFTGELDPNQVKDEIWHTAYEPIETTRTIRTNSNSSSSGSSAGQVSHESLMSGEVFITGSTRFSPSSRTSSSSRTSGSSESSSYSDSTSESVAEVPWYEYHKYQELTSRTFRSLEEQLYLKKAQLKRQPKQHAAILIPETTVQLVKAPTLREFTVANRYREAFLQECREGAGCYNSPEHSQQELDRMEEQLLLDGRDTILVRSAPEASRQSLQSKRSVMPAVTASGQAELGAAYEEAAVLLKEQDPALLQKVQDATSEHADTRATEEAPPPPKQTESAEGKKARLRSQFINSNQAPG